MTGLSEVVRGLARRDGVERVVLVSSDGLPVEEAGGDEGAAGDVEALAALAATLVQHAGRLGEAAAAGSLGTAVLELERGVVVATRAGASAWLLLLVRPDLNLGPLLYDLRRHRPALAELL
jgi:predicted regulator of Ras-like GTPase activity (Roadblock/LC7/MglB family)